MDWKKINLYLLLTFGFSWTVALIMWLCHIRLDSLLGTALVAALFMPGPAVSTFIVQKFIYKEGFKNYGWSFERKAIRWILFTPLAFLGLTGLTFAIVILFGNTHWIPEFGELDFSQQNLFLNLREMASSKLNMDTIELPDIPPRLLFLVMLVQGIIGGSTISLPFMFGEELGWRGLMLKETSSLGFLGSNVFIGLVWGIWHLPVILMGHNYPHHPYFGIIMMCLFTLSIAPLFAYIRIKTKSILGPCMLHGMLNASGAMYVLYIANGNELYSSVAGWAGIMACAMLTIGILLLDKTFVSGYRNSAWE